MKGSPAPLDQEGGPCARREAAVASVTDPRTEALAPPVLTPSQFSRDPVAPRARISNNLLMYDDLTKSQKRALRAAAQLAHDRDRTMSAEDREAHYLEARNDDLLIIVGGAVANGVIGVGDVETAARELVADVAERIRAMIDAQVERPPVADEEEGEDPNAAVSVAAVVREVDALSEEATLYVNKRTGSVTVWRSDLLTDGELERDDEDAPEWLQEAKAEGRELESSPDWCALLISSVWTSTE